MKRPTYDEIDIAIMWLQVNEGNEGEAEACKAVAAWIDHLVNESLMRAAARKNGVSIVALRERLREQAQR